MMKKFRVLSDLHLDLNDHYPFSIPGRKEDKKILTVLCGDTAGETDVGIKWVKKNIKNGLIVSGNHLPYNDLGLTIQELRDKLAKEFPIDSNVSYLDVECGAFKKEIDGVLFIGTCMYSDMLISDRRNPTGEKTANFMISHRNMNDYRFGIKKKEYYLGSDNEATFIKITPTDYEAWFNHAFELIDKEISDNEKREKPLPVVLITHYPLVKKILENSLYVEEDNFASYGSDREAWIQSHPSIRCYCCGHAHDVTKDFRSFKIMHDDGTHCLVVNNARGYVSRCHDFNFNPNRFVNIETWELEEKKETKKTIETKKKRCNDLIAKMSLFI